MFKVLLFSAFIFIGVCFTFQTKLHDKENNAKGNLRVFEDIINKSVECVRSTLSEGIPDLGLPSFNPLVLNNATLDFDQLDLDYLSGQLTIDGSCNNIVNFNVYDIRGDLLLIPPTYTVNFTIHYDDVSCQGKYNMNLTILDYNIWGSGDIISDVTNLTISGYVKAIISSTVNLQDLQAPATLSKYNFNITGLFDDEELSRNVTDTIREKVPEIINANPELFTEIVGPLLVIVYNALISGDIGVGIIQEMTQKCIIDVLFPPSN